LLTQKTTPRRPKQKCTQHLLKPSFAFVDPPFFRSQLASPFPESKPRRDSPVDTRSFAASLAQKLDGHSSAPREIRVLLRELQTVYGDGAEVKFATRIEFFVRWRRFGEHKASEDANVELLL